LRYENELNQVASLPEGEFQFEDQLAEVSEEASVPRMPASQLSWDREDRDEHCPPEVFVEQQPPSPAGRAPEMPADKDEEKWNPDDMLVEEQSADTSQETSAGRNMGRAEVVPSHSEGSDETPDLLASAAPRLTAAAQLSAPVAPVLADSGDEQDLELEVANF